MWTEMEPISKLTPSQKPGFDVSTVRRDFPALSLKVHGKPLVYLDNAATTQKPQSVLDALSRYYTEECSNIHRGIHLLSERASQDYEEARLKVQRFLNANRPEEIIFVKGTTEAINLVAQSYGRTELRQGDEIIISAMEHHSNIVPWQMLCEQTGAVLRVIPITDTGELSFGGFGRLLNARTKFVAITHVSNALGSINPVKRIIEMAHEQGVPVLIDGAQAVPHQKIDVQALDCDFYAFSGHKLYGPTGIGILYGKTELLDKMPPYQGGGDMISSVTFEKTTYNKLPYKFEAGTPNIAGAIGLGAAIDYVMKVGQATISTYESKLLLHAISSLSEVALLRQIGTAKERAGVVSFTLGDIHPHDIGTILDREGIAIRTGHHCAQPVMARFKVPATCRASFSFYNTMEEVDALVSALERVKKVFH